MSKSLRWTFTVPNPGEWRPTWDSSSMSYLIWEMEICPTTNTPHIQGYVRFIHRKTFSAAKSHIHPTAHLELARGSELQNQQYCSKDREAAGLDWGEFGVCDPGRRQGRRTDLLTAIETLKESGIRGVKENHPEVYIKFHGGMEKLAAHYKPLPPRRREMEVTILWGPPGIGKTWKTLDRYPDSYWVTSGRDPWGRYSDEAEVVFDEFHPDNWPIQEMNRYMDIYRCPLNCRYQDKYAYWTKVIIISNIDPASWYFAFAEDVRQAFFRRVDNIVHMVERDQNIFTQEV